MGWKIPTRAGAIAAAMVLTLAACGGGDGSLDSGDESSDTSDESSGSDDFTRGSISFELDDDELPVGVHGQEVDELSICGRYLPTDEEEVRVQDRYVLREHVLELVLGRHRRELHSLNRSVDSPETDFNGHGLPRNNVKLPVEPALTQGPYVIFSSCFGLKLDA